MKKIGIFYGSSMGYTETIAKQLGTLLEADTWDVSEHPEGALQQYDVLILGSSTWSLGELQDDWEGFIDSIQKADLQGKTVALFGLGDAESYPDTFCDAVGILYETLQDKGCTFIGDVARDNYTYDATKAEVDGRLVGLLLDEENESDKTEERLQAWVEQIKTAIA